MVVYIFQCQVLANGGTGRSMTNAALEISAAPMHITAKNGTVLPAPISSSVPPKALEPIAPKRPMKIPKPIPAERQDGG